MVASVTPQGQLRSRPMFTEGIGEDGELWFFTTVDSALAEDIAQEQAVGIVYSDPARDRYVSVTGQGHLVQDRRKLEAFWDPKLVRYFPDGLDEPDLALLQVKIETAEYWDATTRRMRAADHGSAGHVRVDVRAARGSG